ncbi:restriction endonuclease subunit S [Methanothermobacter marburgensis]|uniref:Predicted type I restriction-modification enzyme, subunit S n=1 Tax=Methanothermobacter marburgensis (strain ATCC BAA-927 / DSM 2133 / JCM 14651 / NBRC 100331 / OCM 82 / Marburg) TaxID=79929 RepID=D9PXV2_METTM|nr:restriction endonuclease subunit S [Methanothermobacter marburgensis]ADL59050.1 predicted type I restriction-modification enzyme, subunit S [Methanothermobacter marburgensis str. Marburg]WBF09577.1 restriction endonuclease subunit S [Methanothermobacter marburgensis]
MNLKPYPEYKDSGVEWIGEIPCGWNVHRFKIHFKYIKGKVPKDLRETPSGDSLPYLTMDYLRGRESKVFYCDSDGGAVRVNDGDLLLLWDGSNAGEFLEGKDGYLSSTMVKLIVSEMDLGYSKYLCKAFEPLLKDLTTGMGIPHVKDNVLATIRIPYPSLEEQRKIASFLDSKISKIDLTIEKYTRLIDLLQEKRNALINQAVTKGLNPNVKMKYSGVKWIGEIPQNWELRKISRSFEIIGSGTTPKSQDGSYYNRGTIPWVITGDLNDSILNETSKRITKKALRDYSALKIYKKNSLIVAMYGATIGKISLLNIDACVNQACCVLSNSNILDIKFVFYWFFSNRDNIISLSDGGGQPNISQHVIKNLRIQVPPLKEQKIIVSYLDQNSSKINLTTKKIQKNVDLLKEYKKSLIYHLVTGKVDVKERVGKNVDLK